MTTTIPSETSAPRHVANRTRLRLQQGAPDNLRRHLLRDLRRFAVLVGADAATFVGMAAILLAIGHPIIGLEGARIIFPGGWRFAVALVVALTVTGNYGHGHERRNPGRLFVGCTLAAALPLWSAIWSQPFDLVLARYCWATSVLWLGLFAERLLMDRIVARLARPTQGASRTLFVGTAPECRDAASSPALNLAGGHRSVGFVDVQSPPAPDTLGHIDHFAALLHEAHAETVVLSGQLAPWRLHQIVDTSLAAGCELLVVPRALEMAGVQPALVRRNGQVLIELTTPRLQGYQLVVKRALDLLGACAALVCLSPVFALAAVLVKLDSPGPILFRQRRMGMGGRPFEIWKFRTMRVGSEQERAGLRTHNVYSDARLFKVREDPRVTRFGRWMRRLSVDELPQLFNVLRGEMSLVGPRPPLPSEVALYEAHHYARFDVKPGLTGPWQVSGRNEITDFERVLALETAYIRNWSLLRDLGILVHTIPAVLARRGAH